MDLFFHPIVLELRKLCEEGIEWNSMEGFQIKTKVYVVSVLCDSVARPMVQNMIQFNGKYGCNYCYYEKAGTFPPKESVENRTHEKYEEDLMHVLADSTEAYRGIKGISPFSQLSYFDMIDGNILN